MKTLVLTPFADRAVAWLAMMLLVMAAMCSPAFAQEADTVAVAGDRTGDHQLTKSEQILQHPVSTNDTIRVLVTRVIDGDTFVCVSCITCQDSIRIRVLGIDTFEKARIPRVYKQAADWNITVEEAILAGKATTIEARKILQGKQVTLHRGNHKDQNIDKYLRPLRYVILPDGADYSELMRQKGYNAARRK